MLSERLPEPGCLHQEDLTVMHQIEQMILMIGNEAVRIATCLLLGLWHIRLSSRPAFTTSTACFQLGLL